MRPARIVVGTDGSPGGTGAVRWAAAAAERGGRPLQIVVVYHWQVPGRWYGTASGPADAADERAGAIARAAVAEARAAAPHVEVTSTLLSGDPAPALLRAAAGASMLVVGDRGRGGFSRLLLGSVGIHVATHARCPVTVVRGRPDNPSGAVVLGVDGSGPADVAVDLAFAQAAERRCPLHAITAHPVPVPPARDEVRRQLVQQLAGWCAKYADVAADCEVVDGSVGSVLIDESRRAQLVVVGTRGHGSRSGLLPGPVGLRLLHHARCPVLIARDRIEHATRAA